MVKVFLVDDEAIIRHGIRDNSDWASQGFEFAGEAGDGEYAYPLILKAQPDILVTDIKMPFMDGLELSRLVKKTLPRTRIIVLSGYNEFEYAKEAIKIGISDYLLKPVSSAGLIDALKKAADEIREERERTASRSAASRPVPAGGRAARPGLGQARAGAGGGRWGRQRALYPGSARPGHRSGTAHP